MTLFHLSNAYLTLISVAWAVDAAVACRCSAGPVVTPVTALESALPPTGTA